MLCCLDPTPSGRWFFQWVEQVGLNLKGAGAKVQPALGESQRGAAGTWQRGEAEVSNLSTASQWSSPAVQIPNPLVAIWLSDLDFSFLVESIFST